MISINKLVEIGFTLPMATDISAFLSNIGYVADYDTDDLAVGAIIPGDKVVTISSIDGLKAYFKADTQYYKDIETMLLQKDNSKPNRSRVNSIIVYQKQTGQANFGVSIDAFVAINGNYAQITISSRDMTENELAANKALSNSRLFVGQVSEISDNVSENIALVLKALNNSNSMIVFHKEDTEALGHALAAVMAQPMLGSDGCLYSTLTNVTAQTYTENEMTNFDNQNVGYYSSINPISGGGVDQYASNILVGGFQINGEDTKRKYITFTLDLLLKFKTIEFLRKKLSYQDSSSNILNAMLKSVLIEAQNNDLIIKGDLGFQLIDVKPSALQSSNPTLYNAQTYSQVGWYADALTGRKVIIDLTVAPTDAEKGAISNV